MPRRGSNTAGRLSLLAVFLGHGRSMLHFPSLAPHASAGRVWSHIMRPCPGIFTDASVQFTVQVLGLSPRKPLTATVDRSRVLSLWASHCEGQTPMQRNIPFASIRHMSAPEFVDLLWEEFQIKGIVVGSNYRFGVSFYRVSMICPTPFVHIRTACHNHTHHRTPLKPCSAI